MVIIKSRFTGKFLKRHSGSARNLRSKLGYRLQKEAEALMDRPRPRGTWKNPEMKAWNADLGGITERLAHEKMYSAEAIDARIYATKGSALSSIGQFVGSTFAPEARKARGIKGPQYDLPEHLEIHEIVAGNLCIVDVDDDEETKRRKKEKCK